MLPLLVLSLTLGQGSIDLIGRERADFGDVPNSGKWKWVMGGQFGGTTVLYPAGRSDVRFYMVNASGWGRSRMVRCSRKAGKITHDWIYELPTSNRPRVRETAGTLAMWVFDGKVPTNVPRAVLEDLKRKGGYAAFQLNGSHAGPHYYFIGPDGKESDRTYGWDIPASDNPILPRTSAPYPISPQEKEFLGHVVDEKA